MRTKYPNLRHLLLESVGFLLLFCSMFTSQNLSSQLFEKDGYNELGFYSNGIIFLGNAVGSTITVSLIHRIGIVKSLGTGAALSMLYMITLVFPALKYDN